MLDRFSRFVIIWLLALLSLWLAEQLVRSVLLTASEPRVVVPRGELADYEAHAIELFEALAPSVVYIVTQSREGGSWLFQQQRVGTGSGFIWDAAGHVVTNQHVVQNADRILIRIDDRETVNARLVGVAPDYDLAVVRLERPLSYLRPIPVGSSADLRVGQATYAIGNPFGLSRTLTTGVISALDRRLPTETAREIRGVIQTDAAINPGNSGGPLLDSAGRLIGVNTAILSETGVYSGVGFAVPVDVVNRVVPELIERGQVATPGIGIVALSEELTGRLGIAGVVVERVLPGTPAANAGLQGIDRARGRLGDVITHVAGQRVRTVADLAAVLQGIGVGNRAELTVERNGRTRTVTVDVVDIS